MSITVSGCVKGGRITPGIFRVLDGGHAAKLWMVDMLNFLVLKHQGLRGTRSKDATRGSSYY